MAGTDFYKVLGVSPTASADEIKAAYRELVKKYHPDLFSTSAEQKSANEKLLQINAAYAVIGDGERRREYDQKRLRKPSTPRSPLASARRGRASSGTSATVSRFRRSTRTATSNRRRWTSGKKEILKRWKFRVSPKVAVGIVALIIGAFVAHALWEKPRAAVAWTLLAETVVEPSRDISRQKLAGPKWIAAGNYGARSQCADALKEMVRRDEQEGSRAIFDEHHGTIAITVHVRDEAALAQEYFEAKLKRTFSAPGEKAPVDDKELLKQATEEAKEFIRKNGLTKRVKNYECRQTRVLMPESWLRRKLKELGLVF